MATREELTAVISKTKKDISGKRVQIKGAKKRSRFRGVRIQDQFEVGRSGIKAFRKRKKTERKVALGEANLFGTDLLNLTGTLALQKEDLRIFDLGVEL